MKVCAYVSLLLVALVSRASADETTYRWQGHDFAFCFVTDDGTRANEAWVDTALVMDFRYTIAVCSSSNQPSPTRLTHAQIHDFWALGFEIGQHGATHAVRGLDPSCPNPPRGTLLGYFTCEEPDFPERMIALHGEVSRDTLAHYDELPAADVRVVAYPQHLHCAALIDTLIAAGYIGARTGSRWNPAHDSNGDLVDYSRNGWDEGISLFRIPVAQTATALWGDHSAVPPVHFSYQQFLAAAQPIIDQFRISGGICVVYTHHLGDDDFSHGAIVYGVGSGGITNQDLAWMVDLVRANDGVVMTFGEAIAYYRARSQMTVINNDLVWVPNGIATAVEPVAAASTRALRAYPNPFNPATTVAYALPEPGRAQLAVYDPCGHLVTILADADKTAGEHVLRWDGTDAAGRRVAAGTYVVRLRAGGRVSAIKVIILS